VPRDIHYEMRTVAAGVLERDGRILICRRRADQNHAFKWEFPGGKVEPNETPRAALVRELGEELGIEAECGPELMRYEFAYSGKRPLLLIFYSVKDWTGQLQNRIFNQIEWIEPHRLREFDLLEGDERFLSNYLPAMENGTL
jgi:8-oxo-dGTP diphosphatase